MDESDRESWSFVDEDEAKGRLSPAPSSEVSTVLTQGKMQTLPGCVPLKLWSAGKLVTCS